MNPAFLAWWLDDGDRIADPMELAQRAFEAGRRAQRNEYERQKDRKRIRRVSAMVCNRKSDQEKT